MKKNYYLLALIIILASKPIWAAYIHDLATEEKAQIVKKESDNTNIAKDKIDPREKKDIGCYSGGVVSYSKKEILKYFRIFLDGNERTLKCYAGDENAMQQYEGDLESFVNSIMEYNIRNEKAFRYLLEIIQKKQAYPFAVAAALEALSQYEDKKIITLPIFRKWAKLKLDKDMHKDEEPKAKWKAAQALLKYDQIDEALSSLDELSKFGVTSALGDIFHSMRGKKWHDKGIAYIRKALTYEHKETKMLAALFLIRLEKEGIIKQDIGEIKKIIFKTVDEIIANGVKNIMVGGYAEYSESRALETVIAAFKELKDKDAIPILQRIIENTGGSYVQGMAQYAIEYLKKESK